MNAFLREMAVLGILTTLAEHLLPEGGLRKAGRMVMGLLMMLTILTSLLKIIHLPMPDIGGLVRFQHKAELTILHDPGSYRDTVLASLRRQVQEAAEQAARSAGYGDVTAVAELSIQGEIVAVRLWPVSAAVPAFAGETLPREGYHMLREQVARALNVPASLVTMESGGSVR